MHSSLCLFPARHSSDPLSLLFPATGLRAGAAAGDAAPTEEVHHRPGGSDAAAG